MPRSLGVSNKIQTQPVPLCHRAEAIQQVTEMQNSGNRLESENKSSSFVPFTRMTTNKAKNSIMTSWKRIFVQSNNNKGES